MNPQQPSNDIPSRARQQATDPAPTTLPNGRGSETEPSCRKLDAAAKDLICKHVARGHTVKAAARLVGVSQQAIYKCKRRDPLFRLQLSKQKEQVADDCIETLRKAVVGDSNWRAALHYMRLVHPERFHYKPDTLTRAEHDAWTNEVWRLFESVATPDQIREIHRQLKSRGESPAG